MDLRKGSLRLLSCGSLIALLALGRPVAAQSSLDGSGIVGPRPSMLFERHERPIAQLGDTTRADGPNAAITGAIIGGAVLGTWVAVAGYQFCHESESSNCGGALGIIGGFAMGAVVGAVIGGFIGSAIGD